MSKISYLGLGSNQGKRLDNLKKAIDLISSLPLTKVKKISKVYETKPWGYTEQASFLNLCLEIETKLMPKELLKECQEIEKKLKRVRKIKWGPRTIDIDILIFANLELKEKDLIIPHPLIEKRPFVLIPLADLNKELIIKGKSVLNWLEKTGKKGVKEYTKQIF